MNMNTGATYATLSLSHNVCYAQPLVIKTKEKFGRMYLDESRYNPFLLLNCLLLPDHVCKESE